MSASSENNVATTQEEDSGKNDFAAKGMLGHVKVMMVDDEPLNMDVLSIHLQLEGYANFVCVSDALQALPTMEAESPDVVLLDLVMPEMSGFEILELVRQNPKLKSLPVIVLTSSDDAETKLKALQLGASDFLAKPVDASELALRMRNTLAARAYEQRMKYQDPLTQLPNRLLFTRRAKTALELAHDKNHRGAVVLVNINRFKLINDSLGPTRGDDVLWSFSQRLCEAFGIAPEDGFSDDVECGRFIARIGGDRFVVMIPGMEIRVVEPKNMHGIDEVDDAVERLRSCIDQFLAMMESPLSVGGQDIYLNVFMGVSTVSAATRSVEHLLNNAETAMIHARRRLNTKVAFYSEQMDARAHELLSMENGLRTAVENKEIFVVYQPKVDIASDRIIGAEALVRWMHPEFGLIAPVNFIPLAEDTGMIVSIGEWILREACIKTVEWQKISGEDFHMAVNVSIRQLYEPDFPALVEQVLADTGLAPSCLVIEFTENMIMEDAESNVLKLRRLKDLGVSLSIDDFGTGYSALSYLQRFSTDQLKIDQSFIRPMNALDEPQPIVRGLIGLAHDLGMTVVAEGVETTNQLKILAKLNCDEYQGFLRSKPIASTRFVKLLHEQDTLPKSA